MSKAGRLTIMKSCLFSLPVYFLSLIHVTVSADLKLTSLMRNFLWDFSNQKRKCVGYLGSKFVAKKSWWMRFKEP